MKLSEYTSAIISTNFFIGGQTQLIIDLFEAAGASAYVGDDAAKSWVNGSRRCKTRFYFPSDEIDDSGFINFIQSRTATSWRTLQEAFQSKGNDSQTSADYIVNYTTDNQKIFYWSLLNQFQRIFRLPLSKEPIMHITETFKSIVESKQLFIYSEDNDKYLNDNDILDKICNSINCEIIEPYKGNVSDNYIYRKIYEFCNLLDSFTALTSSTSIALFSNHKFFADECRSVFLQIQEFADEICAYSN